MKRKNRTKDCEDLHHNTVVHRDRETILIRRLGLASLAALVPDVIRERIVRLCDLNFIPRIQRYFTITFT